MNNDITRRIVRRWRCCWAWAASRGLGPRPRGAWRRHAGCTATPPRAPARPRRPRRAQGAVLVRPDGADAEVRQARQVAVHGHAAGAALRRRRRRRRRHAGTLAVSTQAQQALGLRLATVEKRADRRGASTPWARCSSTSATSASCRRAPPASSSASTRARRATWSPPARRWSTCSNPEWLGAQQEYLAVKAHRRRRARRRPRAQRLLLLGMPAALIERVDAVGPAGGAAHHHRADRRRDQPS